MLAYEQSWGALIAGKLDTAQHPRQYVQTDLASWTHAALACSLAGDIPAACHLGCSLFYIQR